MLLLLMLLCILMFYSVQSESTSVQKAIDEVTKLINHHSKCRANMNKLQGGAIDTLSTVAGIGSFVRENRRLLTAYIALAALEIPGDFVETGVYVGGSAAVLMRVLMQFDKCDKKLFAFDSFEGLPVPTLEDHTGPLKVGVRGKFNTTVETLMYNLKRLGAWDPKKIRVKKGTVACIYVYD